MFLNTRYFLNIFADICKRCLWWSVSITFQQRRDVDPVLGQRLLVFAGMKVLLRVEQDANTGLSHVTHPRPADPCLDPPSPHTLSIEATYRVGWASINTSPIHHLEKSSDTSRQPNDCQRLWRSRSEEMIDLGAGLANYIS